MKTTTKEKKMKTFKQILDEELGKDRYGYGDGRVERAAVTMKQWEQVKPVFDRLEMNVEKLSRAESNLGVILKYRSNEKQ